MQLIKSLGLTGLAIVLAGICITPAQAEQRNYTDITGTNIWNNTSPQFKGSGIDPELIARANRLNQEAQAAFDACNSAIVEAEQQTSSGPRRYARKPAPTPPVPQACQRLEELRTEVETLRTTLADLQKSGGNPSLRTW